MHACDAYMHIHYAFYYQVGLAVDDIQTIQKEAALQKLALQVFEGTLCMISES